MPIIITEFSFESLKFRTAFKFQLSRAQRAPNSRLHILPPVFRSKFSCDQLVEFVAPTGTAAGAQQLQRWGPGGGPGHAGGGSAEGGGGVGCGQCVGDKRADKKRSD